MNYQAFALAKGKILIRLENILDKFDNNAVTKSVNLTSFAKQFWAQANNGAQAPSPKMKETLLDGVKEKFKTEWFAQKSQQEAFDNVQLAPQAIRSFVIDYN